MYQQKWDKDTFRKKLERQQGSVALKTFERAYKKLGEIPSINWSGSGNRVDKHATLWPWIELQSTTHYPPVCFRVDGKIEIPFMWMRAPFDDTSKRRELYLQLNRVSSEDFREALTGRPTFPLSNLDHANALNLLRDVFDWYIEELFAISTATSVFPEEDVSPTSRSYREGAIKQITVNARERDPKAREACIEKYGLHCQVCNFDFGKFYGEIGRGFIHVHHLKPVSETIKEYKIDPERDLRPVCPNCHAMLHRSNPPYTVEELKEALAVQGVQSGELPHLWRERE